MKTWIGLLRGINVGGKNKLPMKDLVVLLNDLGLTGVKTYIQSGNVVFQSSKGSSSTWSDKISSAISNQFGFRPSVLVMSRESFVSAMEANPFPQAIEAPNQLHLYFLAHKPTKVDRKKLDSIKTPSEAYVLTDTTFYLYAPDGVGRSKLAAGAEKVLGVVVTARNWRTDTALVELALSKS